MLTVTQIASILMLLNAFGVAPSVVATVQYELTHPGQTAPTQATSAVGDSGSTSDTGSTNASPDSAGATPAQLSCSISSAQINTSLAHLTWLFPKEAQGTLSVSLTNGSGAHVSGKSTDWYTAQMPDSHDTGYSYYLPTYVDATQSSAPVTLTVSEVGFATTTCSTI